MNSTGKGSDVSQENALQDSEPALFADDVSLTYTGLAHPVLDKVNLSVAAGSFCSVIGPTGAGKSTLLSIFGGLIRPTSGRILVFGEELLAPQPDKVSFVFQEASLLPWLTAEDNVAFPLELRGVDRRRRRQKARDLLDLVGLQEAYSRRPAQLSGGMRQRVAIARSLALDPPVLLMDEPFGALDEQTREAMGDGLLDIWESTGKTIVFVTHSIGEAVYLSDTVHVLAPRGGGLDTVDVDIKRPRRPQDRDTEELARFRNILRRKLAKSFNLSSDAGSIGKADSLI